jgi:signal transduction histidine kinase
MAADRAPGWFARLRERAGAIRVRTTAAAVLVVGVSLVIAAVAMVVFLERSLRADVRRNALARAEAVAAALSAESGAAALAVGDPEEEFVQVLSEDGSVVGSSSNLSGRPALVRLEPGQTATVERVPFEDGPFLAVATSSSTAEGPVTVVVGRALEDVGDATRTVTGALAIGIPLLALLVGVVTWRVVGRALGPVERIRTEVEAISPEELHRRVPDPPGDDEIARLAATMNRMLTRLEEGQVRQRRFVSDASHELRSPVAAIRQHAEVALAHPDGTDPRDLAGIVLEEDVRLQGLVEDLLLLTRIDEGTLRVAAQPVDLDDLVLEEAGRLRTSTKLRIDIAGVSAGRVLGDRAKLERLVRNLTGNATRHARDAIGLSLLERDGWVTFAVEDDGAGIAPEDRDRVFDRFVRLEDARDRDSGGSGLGLSIVREVATLHRGTVGVADGALGGARFEVRLPAHPD